jgi:hypothetical protein
MNVYFAKTRAINAKIKAIGRSLLFAATVVIWSSPAAWAETKPLVMDVGIDSPTSFLFVGNSFMYYNNSMHKQFRRIAQAADKEHRADYRATSVTISGSGLNWHDMESYFRPNALAEYSFVGDNEIRFNDYEQLYDVVIMMDCSQCPVHPQLKDRFHEYAAKHSETIIRHGARPVLLMTWAYEDRPEMTAALAEEYTVAGNTNKVLVAPAGLAFARAKSKRPELSLRVADKRHPSLAGTYLAALTIYASIYNRSPVGSPPAEDMDEETATFLQQVAWETVGEYFDR